MTILPVLAITKAGEPRRDETKLRFLAKRKTPARPRVALLIEAGREYGRGLLHGIAEYVRVHGPWSIDLDDRGFGDHSPDWLKNWDGQGIIARVENRRIARELLSLGRPIVDLRGLILDPKLPLIETDDGTVVQLAVEHLRERGFRHFAYCGFPGTNYSDKRSQYFLRQVETAAVYAPPDLPRSRGTWDRERQSLLHQEHLVRWLQGLPRPVGLMACNDIRGQQVLNACREAGIAVPDEIAVIGVDNDEILCDLSEPPLSSVVPDTRRIGYESAALLARLMTGHTPPKETLFICPLGVRTRRSTDVLAIEDRDVASAVHFIRENAGKGIKVEDVLAEVPLSRSTLERRFLQMLGRTPKAEIMRVQLERIQQLLADTDFPLAQVARMTGFEHPEYLSVFFRNQTGQTPGHYRATVQKGKPSMVAIRH